MNDNQKMSQQQKPQPGKQRQDMSGDRNNPNNTEKKPAQQPSKAPKDGQSMSKPE